MKALIQRVSNASVVVEGNETGKISKGLMVLFGAGKGDSEDKIKVLAEKVCNLRIFEDEKGKMNLSLLDTEGAMLVVSQFTLYADLSSGRRPSFTNACEPNTANGYYEKFMAAVSSMGVQVEKGIFGAEMAVTLTNDGPVTIMIEV